MKISRHIIENAKEILKTGSTLPTRIDKAPHFYIAKADDTSVRAFSTIEHEGVLYKIGTKM